MKSFRGGSFPGPFHLLSYFFLLQCPKSHREPHSGWTELGRYSLVGASFLLTSFACGSSHGNETQMGKGGDICIAKDTTALRGLAYLILGTKSMWSLYNLLLISPLSTRHPTDPQHRALNSSTEHTKSVLTKPDIFSLFLLRGTWRRFLLRTKVTFLMCYTGSSCSESCCFLSYIPLHTTASYSLPHPI
jgi:hypothetical protein